MASASDRVFETYELLENIIASTSSPRTIVKVQRVCKSWHTIIKRSATIQIIIFAAAQQAPAAPGEPIQPRIWSRDPLCMITDVTYMQDLKLNNILQSGRHLMHTTLSTSRNIVDLVFRYRYDPKQRNPAAFYRRSFLTQPPCTMIMLNALRMVRAKDDHYWDDWVEMTVRDEGGIRFGLLEDIAHNVATEAGLKEPKWVRVCVGFSASKTDELEDIRLDAEEWEEQLREELFDPE